MTQPRNGKGEFIGGYIPGYLARIIRQAAADHKQTITDELIAILIDCFHEKIKENENNGKS